MVSELTEGTARTTNWDSATSGDNAAVGSGKQQ